eukprot:CAMPEP_0202689266 /NCGR_PEP_ID=MMETSP1385-20130828/4566_1 /ASSEMBLY_ACC=CAM_ASM_000861 /TAXON_ID=933848 /ORGANISM="Elphidium margaritaceum" /LENGTH=530 /DNA_ID=CAMNT_0049344377 /DNA_START=116 /DNA_END=1708 /DNA_ORIENTATION=+
MSQSWQSNDQYRQGKSRRRKKQNQQAPSYEQQYTQYDQQQGYHDQSYDSYQSYAPPSQQQTYYRQHPQQQQPRRHAHQQHHPQATPKNAPPVSDDQLMVIDGSIMEGGGQILRNGTTFAALMKQPIHITNIRGKRSTPGLRKQHSKGIELVHKINGGYLEGNFVKSMEIKYYPNKSPSYLSHYDIDIESAGSVCLLIQTCLPLLLFSPLPCSVTCVGGTNASFAPQIDWFRMVLQPTLKRLMKLDIDIRCIKRGFFPKGGGRVNIRTQPVVQHIPAFELCKRGQICAIRGRVIMANRRASPSVADGMVNSATRELRMVFGKQVPIEIEVELPTNSLSDGIGVVIVAETDTGCLFGGSSLQDLSSNRRGKNQRNKSGVEEKMTENYDEVGRVAARELIADWQSTKGGCTDRHLQDQLIIFMALAKGRSKMATCALELHTETAIYIAEQMTGVKFNVQTGKDGTVWIECDGIGYNINSNGNKTTQKKARTSKLDDSHAQKAHQASEDASQPQETEETTSTSTSNLFNRPSFF